MRQVALLRGINVGGVKVPMAELRAICEALGWRDVATYIQSGNVVFSAAGKPASLEAKLETALEEHFGRVIPCMVRDSKTWASYVAGNAFPEESEREGNRVMLALAKHSPTPGAQEALQARAVAGERVRVRGDAIWIHFPNGAGTSKLTPALFDRAAGSPVTVRNWNTVVAIAAMLG